MTKVKNITGGTKGIRLLAGDGKPGEIVMLEPGETKDLELAPGEDGQTDWFEIDAETADEPGPLDGSVEALTEHLATIEDADEVQKLIDAETAGKSRKGALAALEARLGELLTA